MAGGLAPTVRPGEADLGFQKGLSDWGAQNLDRFQPILEAGRPLLAGGSRLLLNSAGPGACLATSLVNRGAPKRHLSLSGWSTRRNLENRDVEASSWGPPHAEPFRATRQHSTTRGKAPFQRGGLAQLFRAGCTGRKAIYQAVWPLPQRQGGAGGRPLLHEMLLLGARNALRTTEHAETLKIAIWRPRPGDPLPMSHFGPPDSIRRRVGRPLSREGARRPCEGGGEV